MHGMAWYRPELTRTMASAALKDMSVGRYIVRESASQPGCYAISVWIGDKAWHGVITPSTTKNGRTLYKLYAKNKFESIPDLVAYYHDSPIARNDAGQAVVLVDEDEDDE
jgi:hypothetical protein